MGLMAVLAMSTSLFPATLHALALQVSFVLGSSLLARGEGARGVNSWWPVLLMLVPVIVAATHVISTPLLLLPMLPLLLVVGFSTYLVRRGRPTDVRRVLPKMVAGSCLVNAIILGIHQSPGLVIVAVGGFVVSLILHRWVKRAH